MVFYSLLLLKDWDKYEIVAGERRYEASQILNLQTIPAIVKNLSDNEVANGLE